LIDIKINDFEFPKWGFLVIFLQFWAATHILGVNCAEMAWNRPRYEIFSIKCGF